MTAPAGSSKVNPQGQLAAQADLPIAKAAFITKALVTGSTGEQFVPASGLVSSVTQADIPGVLVATPVTLNWLYYKFAGDAGNAANATLTFKLYKNGVAQATAQIAGVVTNVATDQGGSVNFDDIALVAGDRLELSVTAANNITNSPTKFAVALG